MYNTIDPFAARQTGDAGLLPDYLRAEVEQAIRQRYDAPDYGVRLELDGFGSVESHGRDPRRATGILVAAGGTLAATGAAALALGSRDPNAHAVASVVGALGLFAVAAGAMLTVSDSAPYVLPY